MGHVYAWSGRLEEGVSCLQRALADYERTGIGYHHSLSVGHLGEAYLLADQVENARACADRAISLAHGRGERGYEAWALRLFGDIGSHHHLHPDVTTATAHYGAAMSLASELDMRPLVAHCHLGLGKLYRRTGKREQGAGAPHHRDHDVPRDGDDVLAGEGGGADEGADVLDLDKSRSAAVQFANSS